MTAPLSPDADTARQLLERELSKSEYQASKPGLLDRLATAFWNWVQSIHFGSVQGTPALALTVLLVLVGAAIVAVFLIYGVPRLNRRGTRPTASLFGDDDDRSAAELRASAAAAATAGDHALAIVESYRAIARSMFERGLLTTPPGTTARTFAARASAVFTAHATELAEAAAAFDEVRYLDRPGTAAAYRRVRELDEALEHAHLEVTT